jgi:adenylate cyclase
VNADPQRLVEGLAANVHDVWGRKRMDDGWVYGPNRDDAEKTHPGLAPYAQQSESDKDYDRLMAP